MCQQCEYNKAIKLGNYVACPMGFLYGASPKTQYKIAYRYARKYNGFAMHRVMCEVLGISQKTYRLTKAHYMISKREQIPATYHAKNRWLYLREKAQSEQQISAGDVIGLSYPA